MTTEALGFDRRDFLAGAAVSVSVPTWANTPRRDVSLIQDFDEAWQTLADRYCYFDEKTTDWARVRSLYRPQVEAARSMPDFTRILADVVRELYDPHTRLGDMPMDAPRNPPFDLLVNPTSQGARVLSLAEGMAAAQGGIEVGDLILAVDGVPVAERAAALSPRCLRQLDAAATAYAMNAAVAGRRGQPRRLMVAGRGEVFLPLGDRPSEPTLSWRMERANIGVIRISSFAEQSSVEEFDTALEQLRDTKGLILDVRDNGGGDTAVARPIMGRFITETRPYALMRRREGTGLGPFWTEVVEPRGPFTYEKPVVVLCDRWSGSMAEGFPMGMRAIRGARVVGQPMMQLGAGVFPLRLDRTGLTLFYSAEPVYDIHRQPRSDFRPDVLVPDGEDVLLAGLAEIERLTG